MTTNLIEDVGLVVELPNVTGLREVLRAEFAGPTRIVLSIEE